MKVKKFLCGALASVLVFSYMIIPVNAASATLNTNQTSVWSGEEMGEEIALVEAFNNASSEREVYFDLKYYSGTRWKKDKCAATLHPNDRLQQYVLSSRKAAPVTWILQINTYNARHTGCSAYGSIIVTA